MKKASLVRILILSGAFLFLTHFASGQYLFNEQCQKAYQAILSLEFKEAKRLLETERLTNPPNLIPIYLENYIDFLTLFIGENRVQFEELKNNKSTRITLLEKGDPSSPYYRYCLAEVYLQWAFARLKFGDYTTSALEMRRAYLLFKENQECFPSFLINKTGLGVVHIIAGIVPDNYKWITKLMGVEGSLEKGLHELREVAEYQGEDRIVQLFRPEALFFMSTIIANLQRDKREALTKITAFNSGDPGMLTMKSPLVIYARANILMKNGRNDEALRILQERRIGDQRFPFYYLDYLEGIARLNKLDLEANEFFHRYLNHFAGLNYIKSSYQKIAWIYALRGDSVKYFETIHYLEKKGAALVDEDKQAESEMNNWTFPSLILLRARLLFDGGYFDLALKELLDNPVKSYVKTRKDLVEYTYRLARIYHETGNLPKALDYYGQTVSRGRNETYYFATASAYQMGLIYENTGNLIKADSCYRKCLSLKTIEYKTSLNQKAKAGLNRLKIKESKI
ncbi:MAG: hypothetical protein WCO93_00305 [bacterium]